MEALSDLLQKLEDMSAFWRAGIYPCPCSEVYVSGEKQHIVKCVVSNHVFLLFRYVS